MNFTIEMGVKQRERAGKFALFLYKKRANHTFFGSKRFEFIVRSDLFFEMMYHTLNAILFTFGEKL